LSLAPASHRLALTARRGAIRAGCAQASREFASGAWGPCRQTTPSARMPARATAAMRRGLVASGVSGQRTLETAAPEATPQRATPQGGPSRRDWPCSRLPRRWPGVVRGPAAPGQPRPSERLGTPPGAYGVPVPEARTGGADQPLLWPAACRSGGAGEIFGLLQTRPALPGAALASLAAKWDHMEFFKPGKPQPTHRVTNLA
jgi:hypothetical protein